MHATWATGERARGDREAGFTLLEMLVVVGLLGLLTAVAAPAVRPVLGHIAAESARSDLAANLRSARAAAIQGDAPVMVEIAPAVQGYSWNGRRVPLPRDVRLLADTAAVSFFPDGASSGGHFALGWHGRTLDVDVDPGDGLVRLQPRASQDGGA